jgi:hypothetical protein
VCYIWQLKVSEFGFVRLGLISWLRTLIRLEQQLNRQLAVLVAPEGHHDAGSARHRLD